MWVEEGREGGSESEGEDAALGEGVGEGKGGMRIAWRYERMKKFQTTIKGRSSWSLDEVTREQGWRNEEEPSDSDTGAFEVCAVPCLNVKATLVILVTTLVEWVTRRQS